METFQIYHIVDLFQVMPIDERCRCCIKILLNMYLGKKGKKRTLKQMESKNLQSNFSQHILMQQSKAPLLLLCSPSINTCQSYFLVDSQIDTYQPFAPEATTEQNNFRKKKNNFHRNYIFFVLFLVCSKTNENTITDVPCRKWEDGNIQNDFSGEKRSIIGEK